MKWEGGIKHNVTRGDCTDMINLGLNLSPWHGKKANSCPQEWWNQWYWTRPLMRDKCKNGENI